METLTKTAKVQAVKIAVSLKEANSSLININEHFQPENAIITKQIVGRFENNSLKLAWFKLLESIKLLRSKYSMT